MEKGEGEPLVFLHGFALSKEIFFRQVEYFSKQYRVICVDFPGSGKSSPIKSAYGVKEYAEGIAALLETMGIRKAIFVGHSFGGRVAVYLAATTNLVRALVLTNAAGVKPRFSIKKAYRKFRYSLRKKRMGETERMQSGSVDFRTLSPLEKQSFIKVIKQDLTPLLSKITCPTLIVSGDKDRETPPYSAKVFYKRIKNTKLVLFKNTGHFAFLDRYRDFNLALQAFFIEIGGK